MQSLKKYSFLLILCVAISCTKKQIPIQPKPEPAVSNREEPIQTLARDAAGKVHQILNNAGSSAMETHIENHDILSPKAFQYFENAFFAQLATFEIRKTPGEWKLEGDLSKQEERLTFTFTIRKNDQQTSTDSVSIPYDEKLRNTLAQFGEPESHSMDHSAHVEMPVPTPLAQLQEIPLDVAENCETDSCAILLLYSNRLVERNWQTGAERVIALQNTARSRAPSGKILTSGDLFFLMTNNFTTPVVLDRKLNPSKGSLNARFPQPQPGRNTYLLSDGQFFDYEPLGTTGLAVIDEKYHLQIADQGKLTATSEQVGCSLSVSLPYIYVTSANLPGAVRDSVSKFRFDGGVLSLENKQEFDGTIYDIAITDLNRDKKPEMLITLQNQRGIFVEVHQPF